MFPPMPIWAPADAIPQGRDATGTLATSFDDSEVFQLTQDCPVPLASEVPSFSDWSSPDGSLEQQELCSPSPTISLDLVPHLPLPQGKRRDGPQSQISKMATALFHRFQSSELYIQYRNRQSKDNQGKEAQEHKWPDSLELAFFDALVTWPPMGRRKLFHNNKNMGRNELIANHILQLTGIERSRKQVSSHIQVLKPFIEKDPHIMKWLSKDDFENSHRPEVNHLRPRDTSTRSRSRRHQTASAAASRSSRATSADVPSQTESEDGEEPLDMLRPTAFSMSVQAKQENGIMHGLHTYTVTHTNPQMPDQEVRDWAAFRQRHPLLALVNSSLGKCSFMHARASIALPSEDWRGPNGLIPPEINLVIAFLCKSEYLSHDTNVVCHNHFGKHGQDLRIMSAATDVHMQQSESGSGIDCLVKFGSRFWAQTLSSLTNQLANPVDTVKLAEQAVAEHLESISMLQEFRVGNAGSGMDRPLLMVLWEFRLAQNGQGCTQWSRLILPSMLTPALCVETSPYFLPGTCMQPNGFAENMRALTPNSGYHSPLQGQPGSPYPMQTLYPHLARRGEQDSESFMPNFPPAPSTLEQQHELSKLPYTPQFPCVKGTDQPNGQHAGFAHLTSLTMRPGASMPAFPHNGGMQQPQDQQQQQPSPAAYQYSSPPLASSRTWPTLSAPTALYSHLSSGLPFIDISESEPHLLGTPYPALPTTVSPNLLFPLSHGPTSLSDEMDPMDAASHLFGVGGSPDSIGCGL